MPENIKDSLAEKVDGLVTHVKKNLSMYLVITGITATSILTGCTATYGVYLPSPDYNTPSFVPPGYCGIHNRFGCCR